MRAQLSHDLEPLPALPTDLLLPSFYLSQCGSPLMWVSAAPGSSREGDFSGDSGLAIELRVEASASPQST